ncbi:tetratricopeptide repeat protein [Streptomyces sp. NPDC089424]|uniref:tetratricopeptide repeat protein n=1 Tax=Streptomyces sp. NPDC089424 TaxID=3365917 RepID=UPI00380E5E7C
MAQTRLSMQELIKLRRRVGFVGRGMERAAFGANFDAPPEDERHRFRFHVHGNAGVGKTFLVRELEHIARERGALTAYVDEGVGSVPEMMAAVCRQFAAQGHRFKELDRLLAAHRDRRHEAEAAVAALQSEPEGPSAGSLAAARAGLVGLGMVPVVGPFAGALDADRLAQGADRVRAGVSARFRSQEDVQLVLDPERVLTPVLLGQLAEVAAAVPWIVLFLDTYELTGPFLDGWLHEVMTTDRHGALPATVVVVTAGQLPLDSARWGGFADFVTDVPLGPFTETEARGLLAEKGVVAEPVVEEVLRLTGGLPVLVSTLAEQRPDDPADIGDPSATAVERFLKWEHDPARRAVALACALPRRLDMDVFRALVDRPVEEAEALFGWLRGLAFVDDRGDRLRYHDLVREPMLRLQRRRSPRGWTERHEKLAEVYGGWREEAGRGLGDLAVWKHEEWRALRQEETYHLLCARPSAALGDALREVVEACRTHVVVGRHWARMLDDAGWATGASDLRDWGGRLRGALADEADGAVKAMDLLLSRPGLDTKGRATAHALRGTRLRNDGEYGRALLEYDQAIGLDPELSRAYYGRGFTHQLRGDLQASLADLDRANELAPQDGWILAARGETRRMAGRYEEAVADLDRAVALDPTDLYSLACRAESRQALGQYDEAMADLALALAVDEDYVWGLVYRATLLAAQEEWEDVFADLDRAARIVPDSPWVAWERGEAYRLAGRFEDAVAELGRALSLNPDDDEALASRGVALHRLDRTEEALADLDRALELDSDYVWALVMRAWVRREQGDHKGAFEDLRRAVALQPDSAWVGVELAEAYRIVGRHEEALAVLRDVLERDPDSPAALAGLGATHRAVKAYTEALRCLDRALELKPDYGWAHAGRARVCLAVGRSEQALADLDRCVALGWDADWARSEAVELLMRCDRWDEALVRLAEAGRTAASRSPLDELWCEAYRRAGQWAAARWHAERMRSEDPVGGTICLALTVGRSEGLRASAPLWRELARLLENEDTGWGALGLCLAGWPLGDWSRADRGLAELMASAPDWNLLAALADLLTELLSSPDADRARLSPRLAAVAAARDAVRTRYAPRPASS